MSPCWLAGAAGDLLVCETCSDVYHLGCLNPPLLEVFCPCPTASVHTHAVVGSPDVDAGAVAAAAAAAGSPDAAAVARWCWFHRPAVVPAMPPLHLTYGSGLVATIPSTVFFPQQVPEDDWFCPDCAAARVDGASDCVPPATEDITLRTSFLGHDSLMRTYNVAARRLFVCVLPPTSTHPFSLPALLPTSATALRTHPCDLRLHQSQCPPPPPPPRPILLGNWFVFFVRYCNEHGLRILITVMDMTATGRE